jgi:hypothetical protein
VAGDIVVFEAGLAAGVAVVGCAAGLASVEVVGSAAGFAAGDVVARAAGLAAGLAALGLVEGRLLCAAGLAATDDVTACGSAIAAAGAAPGRGGGSAFAGGTALGKGGGPALLEGDVAPWPCGDAASRASGFGSPDFSIPLPRLRVARPRSDHSDDGNVRFKRA